jgi:hypothetical protein
MATKRANEGSSEVGRRNERRKAHRLRYLIDQFHARIQQNSHDLDLQFTRLAQIQIELDNLTQAASRSARQAEETTSKRRR